MAYLRIATSRLGCLALTTALAFSAGAGCGGTPHHAAAEDVPLPPASGTPIGLLLDAASRLGLRADQIDRLRVIDEDLRARNGDLDMQVRELDRPPPPPGAGGGGMGGGMGGPPGGGMGGPPGGGMGGGGHGHHGGGHHGQHKGPSPGLRRAGGGHLLEEKDANTAAAITRAFELLDPEQRQRAHELLDERGVAMPPPNEGLDDEATSPPPPP